MDGKNYKIKIVSSLEKVMPVRGPMDMEGNLEFTALKGETFSFQAAYAADIQVRETCRLRVETDGSLPVRVRRVELVPVAFPCNSKFDEDYLTREPGMYPDLLRDMRDNFVDIVVGQWRSLWISIEIPEDILAGRYGIRLILEDCEGQELCRAEKEIYVLETILPPLEIYHTEWFHTDCLADYYHVEVWSEEHFRILKNFLCLYAKRGMNTILTPTFTPPLDTAVGGERTTVQLVKVTRKNGGYTFDFSLLDRWVLMCRECGIENFEFAHLFTQWGGEHAPKIMAETEEGYCKIFGWETDASGEEYGTFLKAYLGELLPWIRKNNLENHVFFHISDEPSGEHLRSYEKAKNMVAGILQGYPVMDALSEYSFYESGYVEHPIVATNAVEPFLEHEVPGLWVYYCVAQSQKVANRFIAMPSRRNRILGVQLYKFGIKGFLHWGFNFYNSMLSREHINPYLVTDSGAAFPSGDAFLVYPGEGGVPEESIRIMVLMEAMQDLRAMEYLEKLTSREYVMKILEEGTDKPITFSEYPGNDRYILSVRNRINREIAQRKNLQ